MAIATLINLILVLFDLSYIPWRNFYLRVAPQLAINYGERVKGIEPHRVTENYLNKVSQLEDQVAATGLQSAQSSQLLAELRTLSSDMIDENPFEGANKSGVLERIKRRMREQINTESSQQAFATFWTEDYLSQAGWQSSIAFFNSRIRPQMASNYYRGIGENGQPIDRFWRIDIWFMGLFAAELLARSFYWSRRYKGLTLLDALIWRWYDLFLLLPFWRWLRIIPVTVRLNQAKLANLDPLNNKIIHGVVSTFAVEITEVVVLQVIDQMQELLRRGEVARWLLQDGRQYIDLNQVNEGQAIAQRLASVLVDQVLPQIRPEVEALMHHLLTRTLNSSPVYAGLQALPGASHFSNQLTQQIVSEASRNAYQTLRSSLQKKDETGAKLIQELVKSFGENFRTEVQRHQAIEEIQALAIDFLEEVKVNYVQRIDQEDVEKLKDRTKQLYQITQTSFK